MKNSWDKNETPKIMDLRYQEVDNRKPVIFNPNTLARNTLLVTRNPTLIFKSTN